MKMHRRRIITTILLLTLVLGLLYALGFMNGIKVWWRLGRVLHRTDHHALLEACRTLMDTEYRGQYNMRWPFRHPDAYKFPKEIQRLKPTYVIVKEETVRIELWGGMSHYGVIAYSLDFREPCSGFSYGQKKLIDGLWFYSDFIKLDDP
jgi:hypothetical protein